MVKNSNGGEPSRNQSDFMRREPVRDVAFNAVVAALYFALTVSFEPISFGAIQFRISEILVLLCFWRKDLIVGLTIGCVLSNAFSFSYWDILIGSGATLVSCVFMVYLSPRLYVAALWPILFNGLVVGAELTWLYPVFPEYWQNALSVAGGELVVMAIGYVVWLFLVRNKAFFRLLKPNAHASILY